MFICRLLYPDRLRRPVNGEGRSCRTRLRSWLWGSDEISLFGFALLAFFCLCADSPASCSSIRAASGTGGATGGHHAAGCTRSCKASRCSVSVSNGGRDSRSRGPDLGEVCPVPVFQSHNPISGHAGKRHVAKRPICDQRRSACVSVLGNPASGHQSQHVLQEQLSASAGRRSAGCGQGRNRSTRIGGHRHEKLLRVGDVTAEVWDRSTIVSAGTAFPTNQSAARERRASRAQRRREGANPVRAAKAESARSDAGYGKHSLESRGFVVSRPEREFHGGGRSRRAASATAISGD